MTFELLHVFPLFLSLHRWCMLRFYILQPFLGDLALVALNEKKLQAMAPLKTFLPLLKGKGCHRKNEKRLHQITHNITEARPHSKIWVCHCCPYSSICKNRVLTKIQLEKDLPTSVVIFPLCLGWPLSKVPDALA
jgi:hypothetical protein